MWVGFLLNRVWVGSVWSPHCGVCGWVECGLDQVVGVLSSAINNSAQHREIMMCNTHSGWEECGLDQVLGAAHFTDCELHFRTQLDTQPFQLIQIQHNTQYKYNINNKIYLVFVSSSIWYNYKIMNNTNAQPPHQNTQWYKYSSSSMHNLVSRIHLHSYLTKSTPSRNPCFPP